MSTRQKAALVVLGIVIATVLAAGVLVWPAYRDTASMRNRIDQLNHKIAGLSGSTEKVEQLAVDLGVIRERVDADLRTIPDGPDLAQLMRKLSLPVDGFAVFDQTFTAGSPRTVGSNRADAMPLMIEMEATFDSILALLQATESMQRLVRISSVHLVCGDRGQEGFDEPRIAASIAMEAIYQPVPDD